MLTSACHHVNGQSGDGGGGNVADGTSRDGTPRDGTPGDTGGAMDGSVTPPPDADYSTITETSCADATFYAPVPVGVTALVSSDTTVYAFIDGTHWARVSAGAAITEAIPLPAGRSSMTAVRGGVEPNGKNLVLFTDGTQQFASFFANGAFEDAVAVPPNTTQVHSDAAGNIVAVDSSQVLWKLENGTFANYGALPIGSIDYAVPWAVSAAGVVYVAYLANSGTSTATLYIISRGPNDQTWSTAAMYDENSYGYGGGAMAAGLDGSMHLVFSLGTTIPIIPSTDVTYFRSADGVSWAGELIDYDKDLITFAARTYDSAQVIVSGSVEEDMPSGVVLERRCNKPQNGLWPQVTISTIPADESVSYGAFNEVGVAAAGFWTTGQQAVAQRH
ncbi:MAG TPA: hypothetical protein VLX92_31490 [Kofleriaceae bacterium]|nr:hypothetical protein [Kofleriaceae bacterium]